MDICSQLMHNHDNLINTINDSQKNISQNIKDCSNRLIDKINNQYKYYVSSTVSFMLVFGLVYYLGLRR